MRHAPSASRGAAATAAQQSTSIQVAEESVGYSQQARFQPSWPGIGGWTTASSCLYGGLLWVRWGCVGKTRGWVGWAFGATPQRTTDALPCCRCENSPALDLRTGQPLNTAATPSQAAQSSNHGFLLSQFRYEACMPIMPIIRSTNHLIGPAARHLRPPIYRKQKATSSLWGYVHSSRAPSPPPPPALHPSTTDFTSPNKPPTCRRTSTRTRT